MSFQLNISKLLDSRSQLKKKKKVKFLYSTLYISFGTTPGNPPPQRSVGMDIMQEG